jgi:hypothetical protein
MQKKLQVKKKTGKEMIMEDRVANQKQTLLDPDHKVVDPLVS